MNADVMTCISCGMPMRSTEEFAMGDRTKSYCCYCSRPDGTMRSYDEALAGMSAFLHRTQGIDEGAARDLAKAMMAKLPAWKDRQA